MKELKTEFKTIKVEASAIQDLNIISAMTGEKQYEVVTRLADEERLKKMKKITRILTASSFVLGLWAMFCDGGKQCMHVIYCVLTSIN
jgi:hypothetical protein